MKRFVLHCIALKTLGYLLTCSTAIGYAPFRSNSTCRETGNRKQAPSQQLKLTFKLFWLPTHQYSLGGLSMDYFNKIREHTGLTCKSFHVMKSDDLGYNEFVEDLAKCSETKLSQRNQSEFCSKCDVGISGWMINTERSEKVHFPPPHTWAGFQVVLKRENSEAISSDIFFFQPFHYLVWMLIFVFILVFMFLKVLDGTFAIAHKSPEKPYIPTSTFMRMKRFLLRNRVLLRIRRAFQSVSTLRSLPHPPRKSILVMRARTHNTTATFFLCISNEQNPSIGSESSHRVLNARH